MIQKKLKRFRKNKRINDSIIENKESKKTNNP